MAKLVSTAERPDAALIATLESATSHPLWDRYKRITPVAPHAQDAPFLWRWRDLEPLTARAAAEVPIDDVERRAIILANPAFGGATVTTSNLIAAFTVLEPGDHAVPHRHTAAAIRFSTRAEGAVTIVNGRRLAMRPGDLILTPPLCWHGHINESDHRTIWFDAANMPLINTLDASFFEPGRRDDAEFFKVDEGNESGYRHSGEVTRRRLGEVSPGADDTLTVPCTSVSSCSARSSVSAVPRREGIGAAVRRREDPRFLTGRGRFVANLTVPGELACHIVRSPHAYARIVALDTSAAAGRSGVVAVLTGRDMAADEVGPLRCFWPIRAPNGPPMAEPPRWALARDTVRHVGEPVAVVIAESVAAATDAAEHVAIDYEPLRAVVSARDAIATGAPALHADAPGNVCFRWTRGDAAAVEAAFARATRTVRLELINNRLAGAAIEPRAVIAVPDTIDGALTLYSATQVPHFIRRAVAVELGLPEGSVRVIAPDVGGGFGHKGKHYPEEPIVAWPARRP